MCHPGRSTLPLYPFLISNMRRIKVDFFVMAIICKVDRTDSENVISFSFTTHIDFYPKCLWFLSSVPLKNNCTQVKPLAHKIWYFSLRISLRLWLVKTWLKKRIEHFSVFHYNRVGRGRKTILDYRYLEISMNNNTDRLHLLKLTIVCEKSQETTCHHGFDSLWVL